MIYDKVEKELVNREVKFMIEVVPLRKRLSYTNSMVLKRMMLDFITLELVKFNRLIEWFNLCHKFDFSIH